MNRNAEFLLSIKKIKYVETNEEAEALISQGWVYWDTISNQSSKSGLSIVLVKPEEGR